MFKKPLFKASLLRAIEQQLQMVWDLKGQEVSKS